MALRYRGPNPELDRGITPAVRGNQLAPLSPGRNRAPPNAPHIGSYRREDDVDAGRLSATGSNPTPMMRDGSGLPRQPVLDSLSRSSTVVGSASPKSLSAYSSPDSSPRRSTSVPRKKKGSLLGDLPSVSMMGGVVTVTQTRYKNDSDSSTPDSDDDTPDMPSKPQHTDGNISANVPYPFSNDKLYTPGRESRPMIDLARVGANETITPTLDIHGTAAGGTKISPRIGGPPPVQLGRGRAASAPDTRRPPEATQVGVRLSASANLSGSPSNSSSQLPSYLAKYQKQNKVAETEEDSILDFLLSDDDKPAQPSRFLKSNQPKNAEVSPPEPTECLKSSSSTDDDHTEEEPQEQATCVRAIPTSPYKRPGPTQSPATSAQKLGPSAAFLQAMEGVATTTKTDPKSSPDLGDKSSENEPGAPNRFLKSTKVALAASEPGSEDVLQTVSMVCLSDDDLATPSPPSSDHDPAPDVAVKPMTDSANQLKPDKPRADPFKDDKLRADPFKNDKPRADPFKAEKPRADPFKADKPRADPFKADKPRAEPFKADKPRADPFKADKPRADPFKADNPRADPFKADKPRADPFRADPFKATKLQSSPKFKDNACKDDNSTDESSISEEIADEISEEISEHISEAISEKSPQKTAPKSSEPPKEPAKNNTGPKRIGPVYESKSISDKISDSQKTKSKQDAESYSTTFEESSESRHDRKYTSTTKSTSYSSSYTKTSSSGSRRKSREERGAKSGRSKPVSSRRAVSSSSNSAKRRRRSKSRNRSYSEFSKSSKTSRSSEVRSSVRRRTVKHSRQTSSHNKDKKKDGGKPITDRSSRRPSPTKEVSSKFRDSAKSTPGQKTSKPSGSTPNSKTHKPYKDEKRSQTAVNDSRGRKGGQSRTTSNHPVDAKGKKIAEKITNKHAVEKTHKTSSAVVKKKDSGSRKDSPAKKTDSARPGTSHSKNNTTSREPRSKDKQTSPTGGVSKNQHPELKSRERNLSDETAGKSMILHRFLSQANCALRKYAADDKADTEVKKVEDEIPFKEDIGATTKSPNAETTESAIQTDPVPTQYEEPTLPQSVDNIATKEVDPASESGTRNDATVVENKKSSDEMTSSLLARFMSQAGSALTKNTVVNRCSNTNPAPNKVIHSSSDDSEDTKEGKKVVDDIPIRESIETTANAPKTELTGSAEDKYEPKEMDTASKPSTRNDAIIVDTKKSVIHESPKSSREEKKVVDEIPIKESVETATKSTNTDIKGSSIHKNVPVAVPARPTSQDKGHLKVSQPVDKVAKIYPGSKSAVSRKDAVIVNEPVVNRSRNTTENPACVGHSRRVCECRCERKVNHSSSEESVDAKEGGRRRKVDSVETQTEIKGSPFENEGEVPAAVRSISREKDNKTVSKSTTKKTNPGTKPSAKKERITTDAKRVVSQDTSSQDYPVSMRNNSNTEGTRCVSGVTPGLDRAPERGEVKEGCDNTGQAGPSRCGGENSATGSSADVSPSADKTDKENLKCYSTLKRLMKKGNWNIIGDVASAQERGRRAAHSAAGQGTGRRSPIAPKREMETGGDDPGKETCEELISDDEIIDADERVFIKIVASGDNIAIGGEPTIVHQHPRSIEDQVSREVDAINRNPNYIQGRHSPVGLSRPPSPMPHSDYPHRLSPLSTGPIRGNGQWCYPRRTLSPCEASVTAPQPIVPDMGNARWYLGSPAGSSRTPSPCEGVQATPLPQPSDTAPQPIGPEYQHFNKYIDEIASLKQDVWELDASWKYAERRAEMCQEKQKTATDAKSELETKLNESAEDNERLKSENNRLKKTINIREKVNCEHETELDAADISIKTLKDENKILTKKLMTSEDRAQELDTALAGKSSAYDDVVTRRDILEGQLKATRADRDRLYTEIDDLDTKNDKTEKQLKNLQTAHKHVEEEMDRLELSRNELESLKKENGKLKENSEWFEAEWKTANSELISKKINISSLTEELKSDLIRINSLKKSNENLLTANTELVSAKARISALTEELKINSNQIDSLKKSHEEFLTTKTELISAKEELKNNSIQIDSLKKSNEELLITSTELVSARARINTLSEELKINSSKIDSLKKSNEEFLTTNNELNEKLSAEQRTVVELTARVRQGESDRADLVVRHELYKIQRHIDEQNSAEVDPDMPVCVEGVLLELGVGVEGTNDNLDTTTSDGSVSLQKQIEQSLAKYSRVSAAKISDLAKKNHESMTELQEKLKITEHKLSSASRQRDKAKCDYAILSDYTANVIDILKKDLDAVAAKFEQSDLDAQSLLKQGDELNRMLAETKCDLRVSEKERSVLDNKVSRLTGELQELDERNKLETDEYEKIMLAIRKEHSEKENDFVEQTREIREYWKKLSEDVNQKREEADAQCSKYGTELKLLKVELEKKDSALIISNGSLDQESRMNKSRQQRVAELEKKYCVEKRDTAMQSEDDSRVLKVHSDWQQVCTTNTALHSHCQKLKLENDELKSKLETSLTNASELLEKLRILEATHEEMAGAFEEKENGYRLHLEELCSAVESLRSDLFHERREVDIFRDDNLGFRILMSECVDWIVTTSAELNNLDSLRKPLPIHDQSVAELRPAIMNSLKQISSDISAVLKNTTQLQSKRDKLYQKTKESDIQAATMSATIAELQTSKTALEKSIVEYTNRIETLNRSLETTADTVERLGTKNKLLVEKIRSGEEQNRRKIEEMTSDLHAIAEQLQESTDECQKLGMMNHRLNHVCDEAISESDNLQKKFIPYETLNKELKQRLYESEKNNVELSKTLQETNESCDNLKREKCAVMNKLDSKDDAMAEMTIDSNIQVADFAGIQERYQEKIRYLDRRCDLAEEERKRVVDLLNHYRDTNTDVLNRATDGDTKINTNTTTAASESADNHHPKDADTVSTHDDGSISEDTGEQCISEDVIQGEE